MKVIKVKKADEFKAKRRKPDMIKKIDGFFVEIYAEQNGGYYYIVKVPALNYQNESKQKFYSQAEALAVAKSIILLAKKKLSTAFE